MDGDANDVDSGLAAWQADSASVTGIEGGISVYGILQDTFMNNILVWRAPLPTSMRGDYCLFLFLCFFTCVTSVLLLFF